jgi:hypothetical protein
MELFIKTLNIFTVANKNDSDSNATPLMSISAQVQYSTLTPYCIKLLDCTLTGRLHTVATQDAKDWYNRKLRLMNST